jgi:hypothetical protein
MPQNPGLDLPDPETAHNTHSTAVTPSVTRLEQYIETSEINKDTPSQNTVLRAIYTLNKGLLS